MIQGTHQEAQSSVDKDGIRRGTPTGRYIRMKTKFEDAKWRTRRILMVAYTGSNLVRTWSILLLHGTEFGLSSEQE